MNSVLIIFSFIIGLIIGSLFNREKIKNLENLLLSYDDFNISIDEDLDDDWE